MRLESLPGFQALLGSWVVKLSAALPPRRLSHEEIDVLARAAIETLAKRVLTPGEPQWGALEAATQGWIVQRKAGTAPSPLKDADYLALVRHALEGLVLRDRADALPAELRTLPEAAFTPATVPGEGTEESVAKDIADDPFRFAREHLALSL